MLAACTNAHAGLEITVSGGETAARPIAVVPFAQPPETGTNLADIVAADLGRSGHFKPLAPASMLERPSNAAQVDFRNWRMVGALEAFAARRGRSMLELAIGWLLRDEAVASVIAGATSPEQVEHNVRAGRCELAAEDLAEIDRITS